MGFMRKIGGLLFLVGVVCLLYSYHIQEKQKESINQLQSVLEAIRNMDNTGRSESIKEELSSSFNIDKADIKRLIILSIPSIELEAPVLPEPTPEYLNVALTQIRKNQVPGQGNFTIAGHNSVVYGRHFNRLDEIKIGDQIQLEGKQGKFVYQVESKKIIKPTDVDVLNETPGKREITLITCTKSGAKRIAVKGHIIANE